jgi:outer membrane protein assembly factor BamB
MQNCLRHLRTRTPCAVLLLSLTSVALAAPGDWPQFRGPNRDGASTETGLLQELPPGGPPLLWKATGLGIGYSTVSVVGNRLFTIGENTESSSVVALNTTDGKKIWSARLGKPGAPGQPAFEGPRSTPTVEGGLLAAVGQWGEMVCLEAATGKELWRKDYASDFGGKLPHWGYAESPLIDGDKVVITPGGPAGAVVALNKKTGALLWRSRAFTDAPHYSSLIVAQIGGVRQYIQLTADSVAGIAAADGKLLWRAPRKGQTAVIPTPIYSDGCVYVTSAYGIGCNLFKITFGERQSPPHALGHDHLDEYKAAAAAGQFTAEPVYANKVLGNKHGGVIKVGDFVYGHADDKGWTCQDFKTGAAKWQDNKLGKGSLVYADGRFYLRAEDKGTVVLIEATPDGFKEHGRFEQPDRSDKKAWPYPVIAAGKLYLRDMDVLLCYDVKAK